MSLCEEVECVSQVMTGVKISLSGYFVGKIMTKITQYIIVGFGRIGSVIKLSSSN
jgi:hypothetical protein